MGKISEILSSIQEQRIENEKKLEKFERLAVHMVEENKKVNITSILDEEGIATKHFADSISLLRLPELQKEGLRLLDVGCGGGFPGLPLAIMREDFDLVMLDSTEKKIKYVAETAKLLELFGVSAISGRAEDLAQKTKGYRENFDVVTSRAVARLSVLSEICLPFVKVGGYFVAMKAQSAAEELNEAKKGFKTLGGELVRCESVPFTFDNIESSQALKDFSSANRTLIIVKKIKPTPQEYPRVWARITKKPL